ncbi:MAG: cell division protein FtsA [Cytophagaceae bacterium]|nr:cell division protein FtsA [Cytophagaceae bacterium]
MDEKVVVGLDIGSTKVCAVVGRMNGQGTLDILGIGSAESKGVSKGVVLNVTKTIEAVNKAVEQAGNQSNYDVGSVMAGIAGQNIQCLRKRGGFTRETSGSEVMVDDIERLLSDVARDPVAPGNAVLHVLPQEYTVDNWDNIYDPVGMTGMKLQAHFQVITSPTLAIENTRKSVERSRNKLEVDGLMFSPLAAAMAVLTEDEKEAGVALVDIGGGTTDVVVFYKNIVRHVAVIPVAGNAITADVQHGCNVPSQTHAELLKTKFGCALQAPVDLHRVVSVPGMSGRLPKDVSLKNVAIIVEERLKEIAALVCAELIRSGYDNKLSGGLVLTGGTAQFECIEDLFSKITGKDVRVGLPHQHFGKGKLDVAENPAYATAIGLVWRGFRALDGRDDEYLAQGHVVGPPANGLNGRKKEEKIEKPDDNKNFFKKGLEYLKNVVLDDEVGDKDSYSPR